LVVATFVRIHLISLPDVFDYCAAPNVNTSKTGGNPAFRGNFNFCSEGRRSLYGNENGQLIIMQLKMKNFNNCILVG